ncbi:hypothetical protein E2C01_054930 [Portunus trituberculatus]|uniref:MADF domain-containing protein n=1 Tax=Portunus trituberculatus TaxID=210409 RepID=A0A5B7GL40_PORTR|nr:hypothetical protein [Portunus trituberculatus]
MQALHSEIQDITSKNVQTKYTNLRTSFERQLKKIRTVKSGSEGKSEPVDSQWPMFHSRQILLDVVEPGPSCTTATFESHAPVASIEVCSPDESTLEEDEDLLPATGNSTFATNQDVIRIKVGTAVRILFQHCPSPPPVLGTPSQPPLNLTLSPKRTPSRKRKVDNSNEGASSSTLKILGSMSDAMSGMKSSDAMSGMKTSREFSSGSGLFVEKACERLPFHKQVMLLSKICQLLEEFPEVDIFQ